MRSGRLHEHIRKFHLAYGPVVRIAPNELSYADKRAWLDIYSKRPGHQPFMRNRTWFRKNNPGDPKEPQSIFSYLEEDHARFRRAFEPAFSEKSLREQAPTVERYADLLIQQMRTLAGTSVDMTQWFNYFTFDVAGDLSFGVSFGCLRQKKAHLWVEITQDFGRGLALIASLNFYWPLNILLQYFIPERIVQRGRMHREMSAEKAESRLDLKTDRPDFVTPVLAKSSSDPKASISADEWGINLAVIVFAASETTSSALTAILRELLQHGDILRRTTQEVRQTFDSESDISVHSTSKLKKLKQLESVIREGLRLNPPVVIGVPRVVPKNGAMVCGKWVPGGTYVTYNQYPANRQEFNFKDPNKFNPDRFLDLNGSDDLDSLRPFSVGRHNCIGMKLANAEMLLVMARLLWAFDLRLTNQEDRWDWGKQNTYVLWEKRPLHVILTPARDATRAL